MEWETEVKYQSLSSWKFKLLKNKQKHGMQVKICGNGLRNEKWAMKCPAVEEDNEHTMFTIKLHKILQNELHT